MMNERGVLKMPRQEVGEGQEHGYIGEDTKEVEVIELEDQQQPGYTNTAPDVASAQARVDALEIELERAQKALATAKVQESKSKKTTEKPIVGQTSTTKTKDNIGGDQGNQQT